MPERISKAEHEYAGQKVVAGDRFNVEPQDVELMVALGRIEPQEGEAGYVAPGAEPAGHRTRDMRKRREQRGDDK